MIRKNDATFSGGYAVVSWFPFSVCSFQGEIVKW